MTHIPMASELAHALVCALADLSVVEKGRTANAGSYTYDYADLADVVKLTRPVLAEFGIVALTPIHEHGDGLACTVILLHSSGDRLDLGPFPFPHGKDAQATGSMVTYHRRYALVAALGMAVGDDDDGATATARERLPVEYEDSDTTPGLRSSIEAAIEKLPDADRAALKDWLKEHNLPAVRRMSAAQASVVLDYLMALPSEGEQ